MSVKLNNDIEHYETPEIKSHDLGHSLDCVQCASKDMKLNIRWLLDSSTSIHIVGDLHYLNNVEKGQFGQAMNATGGISQ